MVDYEHDTRRASGIPELIRPCLIYLAGTCCVEMSGQKRVAGRSALEVVNFEDQLPHPRRALRKPRRVSSSSRARLVPSIGRWIRAEMYAFHAVDRPSAKGACQSTGTSM